MTDIGRMASDGEAPVNPYSLLEAVNRSSDTAHTAWLIFLAIMAYLMIAVAGVSHEHLLRETPVSLPILQVDIPLTQFFQFAPIVLVLFHLGLVGQLVLLARKTLEFDAAIRLLETSDKRRHPLRLELHNFFFVQAIAGPNRSLVMGGFLHAMSWLTIVVLPVVLILYIQVGFLPYHDINITWTHRLALVVDVAMLVFIGVFLGRAETSFFSAFWRSSLNNPISFGITSVLLAGVTAFSFLFATVPDEALDRFSRSLFPVEESRDKGRFYTGFALPLMALDKDGALFGLFRRNLVVTDTDLVVDREVSSGEPSLNLRGRDLRYAILDRSDLHQADLTGANLEFASLKGTDLRDAQLRCADLDELLLNTSETGREAAVCTSAREADLSRAQLMNADLTGLDLTRANLEEANLSDADLSYAILLGANFSSATLDKSNLTGGIQASGANFLIASLRGADLTGAKLHGADFRSAQMQGAILNYAHLDGVQMADAELEAASLQKAKLMGADLSRANITAADLRGVRVWDTAAPAFDNTGLVDISELNKGPPTESEVAEIRRSISEIGPTSVRASVSDALVPLLDGQEADWAQTEPARAWSLMAEASEEGGGQGTGGPGTDPDGPGSASRLPSAGPADYESRLTNHLASLVCRTRWADGAVATGVTRRARGPRFKGDLRTIYQRLRGSDCPARDNLADRTMQDLATAADLTR